MSIFEKLMNVQNELNAPKNRKNTFGNYSYRSCEDILEAVKPILKKYKTALTITDEVTEIGDRYYIKATATIIDIEDGASVSNSALAREAKEKKGMDESQITGTASSYARKYALNGLFLIDDNKDADTDEAHIEQTARAEKSKVTDIGSMKISAPKVNVLAGDIETGVIDKDKLLKWFKVERLEDITEAQFREYVEKRDKKRADK
jgi:hypothetical protein